MCRPNVCQPLSCSNSRRCCSCRPPPEDFKSLQLKSPFFTCPIPCACWDLEWRFWYNRNIQVIKQLARRVNKPPEDVGEFLYDLSMKNFSLILNPKCAGWNMCRVPYAEIGICEKYMGIFDSYGNLRTSMPSRSLYQLLQILQYFLNEQPPRADPGFNIGSTERDVFSGMYGCNNNPGALGGVLGGAGGRGGHGAGGVGGAGGFGGAGAGGIGAHGGAAADGSGGGSARGSLSRSPRGSARGSGDSYNMGLGGLGGAGGVGGKEGAGGGAAGGVGGAAGAGGAGPGGAGPGGVGPGGVGPGGVGPGGVGPGGVGPGGVGPGGVGPGGVGPGGVGPGGVGPGGYGKGGAGPGAAGAGGAGPGRYGKGGVGPGGVGPGGVGPEGVGPGGVGPGGVGPGGVGPGGVGKGGAGPGAAGPGGAGPGGHGKGGAGPGGHGKGGAGPGAAGGSGTGGSRRGSRGGPGRKGFKAGPAVNRGQIEGPRQGSKNQRGRISGNAAKGARNASRGGVIHDLSEEHVRIGASENVYMEPLTDAEREASESYERRQKKSTYRNISNLYNRVVTKPPHKGFLMPKPIVRTKQVAPVKPVERVVVRVKRGSTSNRRYLGEPIPVLMHEPYDEDKPWTWLRRHPQALRVQPDGKVAYSKIHRYKRESVRKAFESAQSRWSVHSAFSDTGGSLHSLTMFGRRMSAVSKKPSRQNLMNSVSAEFGRVRSSTTMKNEFDRIKPIK